MTEPNPRPISRIIIAGGGTAGWMSAAMLRRSLPPTVDILLIESEDIATVGVGEATIPTIRAFNQHVGIDEAEFIRATEASFKLGIQFVDWGWVGNRYFHGFGDFGPLFEGLAAHQVWRRLRDLGDDTPLEAYSLPTQIAQAGRFCPPSSDPRSPAHAYSYAFHFDAGLYARYLRTLCEARGVHRRNARIAGVNLNGETGFIRSLALDDGSVEAADLFIDCTGFRGLLIEGALKTGYTDWSAFLPVDRAWAVPSLSNGQLTPYTRATARAAGWQWRIPLQHRTGNGHVFASRFMDEETARDSLMASLDGTPLKDPMLIRFQTGHRNRFWAGNCLSIGLSSGFLEPLESTSINFIQSGITRLLELFPASDCNPLLIREYNQRTLEAYARVRDFIILHYRLNRRDEPLWRYCADMPIPDDLAEKMALYALRGEVLLRKYDEFAQASWISIYNGQGLVPQDCDPLIDRVPVETLRDLMAERRQFIRQVVDHLPDHSDFIVRHCPSPNFMKARA